MEVTQVGHLNIGRYCWTCGLCYGLVKSTDKRADSILGNVLKEVAAFRFVSKNGKDIPFVRKLTSNGSVDMAHSFIS